jgi:ABC-type dipeptide/oligopeptide/nickel transport system permease component
MFDYILKRILQSILVLIGVTVICFFIFQYLGDAAMTLASEDATQEQLTEARRTLGLDLPLYQQYGRFVWRVLHADFGMSFLTKTPALEMVLKRMPATLELAVAAMIIATLAGGLIGIYAAVMPRSVISRLAMIATLGGISIPTFLTGILLIYLFSIKLGWFPPFSRGDVVQIGWWSTGFLTFSGLKHLFLPAFTLAIFQVAMSTRVIRGEMMEVLVEDYIRTARAKGLSRLQVTFKHAIRNALIPFITIVGLQLGNLIAFAIVVETVFQWPGMGSLLIKAIGQNDQPVVITYIMIVAVMFVFINLTVDILYSVINPRIAYD